MTSRYPDRRVEWLAAQIMVAIGVYASAEPSAFATSRMSPILDLVPLWLLSAVYLAAGSWRVVALYFSLGWWGCQMRAAGALVGFVCWVQMGYALAVSCIEAGVPVSTQICVYLILGYHEVRSIARANDDARGGIANGAGDAAAT